MEIRPNNTLYVNNLNEKVKIDVLKRDLHSIFRQFGEIIEILASKTLRRRGQAYIVFKQIAMATKALNSMQGFPFMDKPMRIAYAKKDSNVIAKLKGTYVERTKEEKKRFRKEQQKLRAELVEQGANNPPNHILFVSNLPPATQQGWLHMLFSKFAGLKEVRLVPNRPGIGFVEFTSEAEASEARKATNDFRISPTVSMKVIFAKK